MSLERVLVETIRLRRQASSEEAKERARIEAIAHSKRLRRAVSSEVVRLELGGKPVGYIVNVYRLAGD